ncbi:hypothetical protein SprV_0702318500 [Sparganum proliferum]
MRIHESGINRSPDTPFTSSTPTTPNSSSTPSPCAPITTDVISVTETDTTDLSCSHCPRTFTSCIGLVYHLRIHRTETGEPVPEAPAASTLTVHTALAHSYTTWAYSATGASTKTSGRQPPAAPNHHILPHHHRT